MPPAPKSAGKSARYPERTRQPRPRLHSAMPCDTAFRVVARGCLWNLIANQRTACRGDAEAVHQMRIALTRLRTAISFFSPMVADPQRTQIRSELKWLHSHLGAVRDLDVSIERLREVNKRAKATPTFQALQAEACGKPSISGAGAPVDQVSASRREHNRLDRDRPLVHEDGKASHAQAQSSHRFIQCA